MVEPNYARQVIYKNNIDILTRKGRILLPKKPFEEEPDEKFSFGFWVGENSKDNAIERKEIKLTDIVELLNLGFVIKSIPLTGNSGKDQFKTRRNQKRRYVLLRKECTLEPLQAMPKNHFVRYDTTNLQLKLEGPNIHFSAWVYIKKKKPSEDKKRITAFDIIKNKDRVLSKYRHDVLQTNQKDFIKITEIPIMISEQNEIICIPQRMDEPRILILGTSGFGKTYTIHGIVDRAIKYLDVRIADLNDSQSEKEEWATPNDDMALELKYLNEKPLPLPTIYLTPSTDNKQDPIHELYGVGYTLALPYEEIILNANKYFDLQGSSKYFEPLKHKLLDCKNVDDFMIEFASSEPKPPLNSLNMVRAIMNDLYSKKIVDIWSDAESKWAVYKNKQLIGVYNPIIASMIAGCVPILQTYNIQTKNYFKPYFQYLAEDIFEKQNSDSYLIQTNTKIWVLLDEFLDIVNLPIIDIIQRRGRLRRIGTIVSTQYYEKIPIGIKANVNYLFCFNALEAKQICRDFKIDKIYANRIQDLGKLEFMAYTKEEFVVYDVDGNKRFEKGPFIGKSLPPLSKHKAPLSAKKDGKKRK